MKKTILRLSAALFAATFFYYLVEVIIARVQTPQIVKTALASERMKLQLNDLSEKQLDALLTIQDKNFYNHSGVDFITPGTGITTLSQGLVKMYDFDNFQPGFQKIKQTLIARFAFDPLTPKDTILTLFINGAYLGHAEGKPIKGFDDGAQRYFNKKFNQLDWEEYLSLIAMIRVPLHFHYLDEREKNLERVRRIKKVLSGEYVPRSNRDFLYDGA